MPPLLKSKRSDVICKHFFPHQRVRILAKNYGEQLGPAAMRWIQEITAVIPTAEIWLVYHVPQFPHGETKEPVRSMRLLTRRLGFSTHQMTKPHIKIKVGFALYGSTNAI